MYKNSILTKYFGEYDKCDWWVLCQKWSMLSSIIMRSIEFCKNDIILYLTFYCELPTAITPKIVDFIEHFFFLYKIFFMLLLQLLWFLFDIIILFLKSISSCIMRLDKILPSIVNKTLT